MLTEQEIMNYALKEMQFHEDSMAKKYAFLSEQITEPKLQQIIKSMEQNSRNDYSTLSQVMTKFSVV